MCIEYKDCVYNCYKMLLEDGEARRRRNKRELVDARPSNAARCCQKSKVTKRDLVVASTRHHRARLVSSNRECFAPFKHISYFFNKYSLSLYVYTRRFLGCLLGFWPLGQKTLRRQKPPTPPSPAPTSRLRLKKILALKRAT